MEPESRFEKILFTTVRIECQPKDGDESNTGTGFIYSHYIDEKQKIPFIITNKHIINDMAQGYIYFIKGDGVKPLLGEPIVLEFNDFSTHWFGHPDPEIDIAILPFGNYIKQLQDDGYHFYYNDIGQELVPTEKQIHEMVDAIEDVIFIGYPNNIFDETNLLPIVRKGLTATPISIDFNGEPKFLIDASIFPGSSGSPVFICNFGSYPRKKGGLGVGDRFFFLGIVSDGYYLPKNYKLMKYNAPSNDGNLDKFPQMIDLGVVYKSKVIKEFIEEFLRKMENND